MFISSDIKKKMSKLIELSKKFPNTEIWTDSFHVEDHVYGIEQNNTGVTTSPTWVSRMMCNENTEEHELIIRELKEKHPEYCEQEIIWEWTLEMGRRRSQIMLPLWKEGNPTKGRFSIQTSIFKYNNAQAMIEMSRQVHACNENMQVKIPSTAAGIVAMEEATYLGISVMATLCYSVDQAIAVAEAIESGLKRREDEGLANEHIHPVCAVLLGMQDDWLKEYADKKNIVVHPDAMNWGGVSICKKVYNIYKERNYKTRILTAYYRHQLHFSEFIGGDLIMTIPTKWQKRFAASDLEIKNIMNQPVEEFKLNELMKLEPFNLAYQEGSLKVSEFDCFPPVVLTLHYFTDEYEKAIHKVRNMMLIKP